jgi:hypothetical protein
MMTTYWPMLVQWGLFDLKCAKQLYTIQDLTLFVRTFKVTLQPTEH